MQENTGSHGRFDSAALARLIDAQAQASGGKCAMIDALAARCDVTAQTVRNWRNGSTEPRVSEACVLAAALGVTIADLVTSESVA